MAEFKNKLDPAIVKALDDVLTPSGVDHVELFDRIRALIENCLEDNYDQTDVRSVIDLAKRDELDDESEEGTS